MSLQLKKAARKDADNKMNILEFIGSLEAIPFQIQQYARDKDELALRFGLNKVPTSLPIDVNLTRIPDQALDGYFARLLLSDPTISQENFAHYAFTISAIFAAQQLAIRSGADTRLLDIEYPVFVSKTLDAKLMRIVSALNYIPLIINWWQKEESEPKDNDHIAQLLKKFKEREISLTPAGEMVDRPIQQILQTLSFDANGRYKCRGVYATQDEPIIKKGAVGLLVMADYGNAEDYTKIFELFSKRFCSQITVLIYDKRTVVDACLKNLIDKHLWRGMALKHLTYRKTLQSHHYTLLALQSNLFSCVDLFNDPNPGS
jgi:hypothetical protein